MPKALSVSGVFSEVGYQPHSVQRRIHAQMESKRFRVVCAGRRTGKSTLGGHELTPRAMQAYLLRDQLDRYATRHEYWIVGPEYSDAEKEFRVLWGDLTRLGLPFDKPGSYNDPIGGNMHISLWDGKFQVHGKSSKYPDTLVGEGLKGVIMAEAAKQRPSTWTKYIRPMLADYHGWALFSSTPEGKNWFYDAYMRGLAGEHGWWSIRMPSWSNDVLFPDGRYDAEIVAMEAEMSAEKFNQEIGADFTEFVGRVFKDFDEETHVGRFPYNPDMPLFIATDYGFTNPNVALFIQMDIWDNVYVIAEYYRRNRTTPEFAQDVFDDFRLGPLARVAREIYPDPEDPGATTQLADKWGVTAIKGTGGLLRDRIDMIRRWLKIGPDFLPDGHPERAPKLFFDFSCVNAIREMGEYRYPDTKEQANEPESPLKKDDHVPEALGRFMAGKLSKTVKTRGRARVRQAKSA
jgi:hypothetical protein